MFMAELSRSTKARFAMRMFGTVCNDLNRTMIAITNPFPSTEDEARMDANTLIATLAKSGFAGYIIVICGND